MGWKRRSGSAAAVALAVVAATGGAAQARPVPVERGAGGPVVTHPASVPYEYPAGEVCDFPARAEFPVSDLTLRTWVDGNGTPVFAIESGALVLRATNLRTGATVDRDVSGTAVIAYSPHADAYVMSGNDWATGFHTGDEPAHRWIVAHDHMSVRVTTTAGRTTKQLLALRGAYEDLCATLAEPRASATSTMVRRAASRG